MKTLKWIVWVSCMMLVLPGCDYPNQSREFLTETDKRMLPYKKGENIHFLNENGILSTLEVSEDKMVWKEDWGAITHLIWECREVCLSLKQDDLQFNAKVESGNTYHQFSNVRVQTSSGCDFRVNYDLLGLLDTHDSLEINHHVYYDVAVVKDSRGKGSQLCYNTDYGILQVTQDDKDIFTLVP